MVIRPDDEVYRVDAVWLGPQGMTLPWSARYSAYGIWLTLFVTVLLVEAVLPMSISIPPVWEVVLTILATYALTGVIDHERPLASVVHLVRIEMRTPRARKAGRPVRVSATQIRSRSHHAAAS
ncbi:hypothetical protein EDD33_2698 [Nocardioides aurantiacus]|uniref:TcpE family protein n=1 Tax=Nocardioides aurantiacus TaxID=86796 RepID=A0A3N2CW95_9ACTN|nr:hypothetical protein EDD33_2698 [Nocardioides aurantiacus]